jgi:hypothetical protein
MQKVVNSTVPKNNLFHQVYSFTTLEVAFSHLFGFTEQKGDNGLENAIFYADEDFRAVVAECGEGLVYCQRMPEIKIKRSPTLRRYMP